MNTNCLNDNYHFPYAYMRREKNFQSNFVLLNIMFKLFLTRLA